MAAEILVGTCNWADHKEFYPPELERGRRQREKLEYYARYFPMVEIDTSFYGIPKPEVVDGWIARTPDGFRFNIKAYRSLTRHEREGGRPRPPTDDEVRDFLAALAPLRESGRLGAVHYQFPPWFTNRPEAREVLLETRDRHPDDIVAIEFRHRSWFDNDAWPATEDLLRELDCVYVGVDAPQLGSGTARRRQSSPSRRHGCASRVFTDATARRGTAPTVPPATTDSTTCTPRVSWRNGCRRSARLRTGAHRCTCCSTTTGATTRW